MADIPGVNIDDPISSMTSGVLLDEFGNPVIDPLTGKEKVVYNDLFKTQIITQIIELCGSMTDTLQKAAMAQADILTLYANWQNAYTILMSQVPYQLPSGPSWATGTDTVSIQARTQFITALGNVTSTLQNRQSMIGDSSKALQSAVNQSNDAVNAQASIAVTLLQEVQGLLSAIYR